MNHHYLLAWAAFAALAIAINTVNAEQPPAPVRIVHDSGQFRVEAVCTPKRVVEVYRGAYPDWVQPPTVRDRCPAKHVWHRWVCLTDEWSERVQRRCARVQ